MVLHIMTNLLYLIYRSKKASIMWIKLMSGGLVLQENKEGLELLKTAIAKAGYTGKVASWIFLIFLIKFRSRTSSPPLVAILP